jgi:hypothetical protein
MKTVDRSALDRVAAAVRRAQEAAGLAEMVATYDGKTAHEQALAARRSCDTAIEYLDAMGAHIPEIGGGPAPVRSQVPLELLDTPETRALVAALEAAAAAGAAVDRQRGWVDSDGDPVGYGETFAGFLAALRVEVYGPKGKE